MTDAIASSGKPSSSDHNNLAIASSFSTVGGGSVEGSVPVFHNLGLLFDLF